MAFAGKGAFEGIRGVRADIERNRLLDLTVEFNIFIALIERKSRVPQIQGVKDEAVVNYCESFTTQEMGYHRLSRRVNKIEIKYQNSYLSNGIDTKM